MDNQSVPYNVPQQRRSHKSLERLLDAAEQQINAVGIESFTIADVVARANLSVGAFYARFPDKTALLHSLQDRFHKRVEPALLESMREGGVSAKTLAEAIDGMVDLLVAHMTSTRQLSRAFMMSSVFDPVMRARGEQVNKDRREAFASVLLSHRDEIGHPDPMVAIEMAYGMYAAVVRGGLVFGQRHELHYDISNQTIAQEMKRALTLYLRGENSEVAFCPATS